jgi:hypothetical protein
MNKMTEETGQRLVEAWAEYAKNVDWHGSISENVCEAFRAGYVTAMRHDGRLAEQVANAIAREVIHKTKATLFDGETIEAIVLNAVRQLKTTGRPI